MKELSIEEKAKAYDIALKKLKRLFGTSDNCTREEAEYIFPELAESEDERIRKELIDFLEYYRLNNVLDSKIIFLLTDSVAWLKKQGEQKPALDVEIPFGAKDSELEEVTYDIPKGYHAEIEDNKVVIKKGEKKSSWSKEDEDIIRLSIENLTELEDRYGKEYGKVGDCIDWLEFLKERVQPQPKQEWSEEEIETCAREAEDNNCIILAKHIRQLKSLKDRYTWKPSDEHYELKEFAKIVRGNLTGISKDVQKLFEAKYLQLTGNKMYGGFKD